MRINETVGRCLFGCIVALTFAGAVRAADVKVGHLGPADDPRHEALMLFADQLKAKTGGALKAKIYPNGTLGSQRELFEQLQAGVTEFAQVGSIISNFHAPWALIDMPFLWKDRDHLFAFLDGPDVKRWAEELEAKTGVTFLAVFERNPRILATTSRPVTKLEDLAGMKIRTPKAKSSVDTWRTFGVEPVPMPASEFYMGLKLGTIDGMENPVEVMYHWKINEVAPYLSLTRHKYGVFFFLASAKFFNGLSPDQQKAVREATAESSALLSRRVTETAEDMFDKLREAGMKIVEPDISGFVEASKQVHQKYLDRFGPEAYERALKAAK